MRAQALVPIFEAQCSSGFAFRLAGRSMSTLEIHEKLKRPSPCWYCLPGFQKGSNSCVDELADAGRAARSAGWSTYSEPAQDRFDQNNARTRTRTSRRKRKHLLPQLHSSPIPAIPILSTWDPCPISPIVEISRRPRRHTTLHIDQQHSLPEMPR